MAVELSSDEQARVATARLPVRPNYYNAALQAEQAISQDFEAFLILQNPVTIASTLTWLTTAGLLSELAIDRDSLAFEALVVSRTDTADQLDEVTDSTTLFTTFRNEFQAGKFSEATEVSLVIRDLQATADELFAKEDQLRHRQQVEQRVENNLSQSVSPAQLRELQSWPTPLSTYTG